MKTINIHGKQYVEVKERIKYFRENFKDWSLTSEVIDLTEDRCVIKATISNEKGRVIASGIAYESKGSSYINKTSFIENCETSAWGRALANIGIGLDVAIASADEVLNAKAQDNTKKLSKSKLDNGQLQAMIVAIGKGESDKVKEIATIIACNCPLSSLDLDNFLVLSCALHLASSTCKLHLILSQYQPALPQALVSNSL